VSDPRWLPDFLLVALLLFAMRFRPAWGAGAGFAVGLMTDALSPATFGAAALAHTLVGYLAGMLKAVFFTDNLLVNAMFFFAASWLRDALQISVGGLMGADAGLVRLFVRSPVDAAANTAVALAILVVFRGRLGAEEPALGPTQGGPG
jgi:rod shape-determining protein MreD